MKKLLFVAALGVAGFMSAESKPFHGIELSSIKNINLNHTKDKTEVKKNKVVYNLVKIRTRCGKDFYLNSEDYTNMYSFLADVKHFTDLKCGSEGLFAID